MQNNPLRYSDPTGHALCEDAACKNLYNPVTLKPITGAPVKSSLVSPVPAKSPLFSRPSKLQPVDWSRNVGLRNSPPRSVQRIPLGRVSVYDKFDPIPSYVPKRGLYWLEDYNRDRFGTVSINFGGSLFAGAGIRGGVSLNFDMRGNFSVTAGGGGGGYTAIGFSKVGTGIQITNAHDVRYLAGYSVQSGLSGGEGLGMGAEMVWFSGNHRGRKQMYKGLNVGGGATLMGPLPAEFHGTGERALTIFEYRQPITGGRRGFD